MRDARRALTGGVGVRLWTGRGFAEGEGCTVYTTEHPTATPGILFFFRLVLVLVFDNRWRIEDEQENEDEDEDEKEEQPGQYPWGGEESLRMAKPGQRLAQEIPRGERGDCVGTSRGKSRIRSLYLWAAPIAKQFTRAAEQKGGGLGMARSKSFLLYLTRGWNFANRHGLPKRFDGGWAAELTLAQTQSKC